MEKSELFDSLPPAWPQSLLPTIAREVREANTKVVVLDDDPTGTQTVHDLWVLTHWSPEALREALSDERGVFYILTNSRSLPERRAVALVREIAANLATVATQVGCRLEVISRSDSTLRGHFPAEVDALQETLEQYLGCRYDGLLICPFFLEGGRFTAHDVHWVSEGENLIPVGQTEYARDATFGYRASNLRQWVAEKTRGRIPAGEVGSISLETIRIQGPDGVLRVLRQVRAARVAVVNAVSYRDMEVVVAALLRAEAEGQRFLLRTAASFVRRRAGLGARALLTSEEMAGDREGAGLIVVGSYVDKTTRQLQQALTLPGLEGLELQVARVLDASQIAIEITRISAAANAALAAGRDALIYTSRDRITAYGQAGDLDIGTQVSQALVEVVRRIAVGPRYIIVKGGITASDVATKGLDVRRAWVLGQILPGVPVWRLGEESRFPGAPYVVFPGNVGDDESLKRAIERQRAR